jgi:pyridoxal phosphate enzyme (YggS family)
MGIVADNLAQIQDEIATACTRAGRSIDAVRLMAVSKRQPVERLREAIATGVRLFGESRVQETAEKRSIFPADAEIHLIGHLQRNKSRDAARLYDAVDSIDAERTARALNDRLAEANEEGERSLPVMPILLEVNTSGEESKQGVTTFDELEQVVDAILPLSRLTIRGLMTIGPISTDEKRLRRAFADLREYRDRLTATHPGLDLPELSMGMSNDFAYAILEGATTVRVGTAIFGERAQ